MASVYGRGPYGFGRYSALDGNTYEVGGATQIIFSTKWIGPARIRYVAGQTQISFSVWGELVKTWDMPDSCFVPCEPGTWTQQYPPWVERLAA